MGPKLKPVLINSGRQRNLIGADAKSGALRSNIGRYHSMSLLLIIVLVLVLFGGGGGYYAHRNYGGAGLGGVLGVVLIVLLVLFLFGGIHA
jgi:hypothetical protein